MTSGRRYEVLSHADLIGWSAFEHRDPPMGVAFGRFIPAPAYANVQAAVRATFHSSSRVEAQRALALTIRTPAGVAIPSQSPASIADASTDENPDDIEIEMLGVSDYERYFADSLHRDA